MFCDHCGNQIEEKAIVCVKCGMSTEILVNFLKEHEQNIRHINYKLSTAGEQIIDSGESLLKSLTLQIWMGITNFGFGLLIYFIDDYGPWEESFYKLIYWTIIITNGIFIRAIYLKMLKGYEKITEAGFTISQKD
jgi:hypothetical protein